MILVWKMAFHFVSPRRKTNVQLTLLLQLLLQLTLQLLVFSLLLFDVELHKREVLEERI